MNKPLKPVHTAGQAFNINIETIRSNARKHVMHGAKTADSSDNSAVVIEHLNAALATGIACSLRYKRHYFTAKGLSSEAIADECNIHAQEELAHADLIAERIVQLGGAPDNLVSRNHADELADWLKRT